MMCSSRCRPVFDVFFVVVTADNSFNEFVATPLYILRQTLYILKFSVTPSAPRYSFILLFLALTVLSFSFPTEHHEPVTYVDAVMADKNTNPGALSGCRASCVNGGYFVAAVWLSMFCCLAVGVMSRGLTERAAC